MTINYINIDNLIPNEYNPRYLSDSKYQLAITEMRKPDFEFVQPIVINKARQIDNKYVIIGGHQRYIIAKQRYKEGFKKYEKLPCYFVDISDIKKEKELNLKLNNNWGDWDWDLLSNMNLNISELINVGFDEYDLSKGFDLSIDTVKSLADGKSIEEISEEFENKEIVDEKEINIFDENYIKSEIQKNIPNYKKLDTFINDVITLPQAIYQLQRLCNGYKDGYNISLLFNPHRVTTKVKSNNISYFDSFSNEKVRKNYATFLYNFKYYNKNPSNYNNPLAIGVSGIQYVSEFKPYLARDIYEKYTHKDNIVLDPCCGWGGRMIGAFSTKKNLTYVGTEPAVETYKGLLKLYEFLSKTKISFNINIYNSPFENIELNENSFDFAFTSPPYFDTEQYSNEDTQSYVRYKTYEDWVNIFLTKLILNTMKYLKANKFFLVNVGNIRYNISDRIFNICKQYNLRYRYFSDFDGNHIGRNNLNENTQNEMFIEIQK